MFSCYLHIFLFTLLEFGTNSLGVRASYVSRFVCASVRAPPFSSEKARGDTHVLLLYVYMSSFLVYVPNTCVIIVCAPRLSSEKAEGDTHMILLFLFCISYLCATTVCAFRLSSEKAEGDTHVVFVSYFYVINLECSLSSLWKNGKAALWGNQPCRAVSRVLHIRVARLPLGKEGGRPRRKGEGGWQIIIVFVVFLDI